MTDQQVERGADEENSGVPLTETEVEVSKRAPSEPADRDTGGSADSDEAGQDAA